MKQNSLFVIMGFLVLFLFTGCANSPKPDPIGSLLVKCVGGSKANEWSLHSLPTNGLVSDVLAAKAALVGNDGGFTKDVQGLIKKGINNFGVSCPSEMKLQNYMQYFLSQSGDNELKGISFCIVGAKQNAILKKEELRTGATIRWYQ